MKKVILSPGSKIFFISLCCFVFILNCSNNTPVTEPESTIPVNLQRKISTNTGPVYSLAFSSSGEFIAAAGYSVVQIWDVETGELMQLLNYFDYTHVWCVSWSEDGNYLLGYGRNSAVIIWDTNTFSEVKRLETGPGLCARWSPDNSRVAVGTESGVIQIWDFVADSLVYSSLRDESPNSMIVDLTWSVDSHKFAAGYLSGEIVIVDALNRNFQRVIHNYSESRHDVNGVLWLNDTTLISANQDRAVRVWNSESGELIHSLSGFQGWTRGLSLIQNSQILITTCEDKNIRLFNTSDYSLYYEHDAHPYPIWSVAVFKESGIFATGAGNYNTASGGELIIWKLTQN